MSKTKEDPSGYPAALQRVICAWLQSESREDPDRDTERLELAIGTLAEAYGVTPTEPGTLTIELTGEWGRVK